MAAPERVTDSTKDSAVAAPRPPLSPIQRAPVTPSILIGGELALSPVSLQAPSFDPKGTDVSQKANHTGLSLGTANLRLTGAAAMAEMKRNRQQSQRQQTPDKSDQTARQTSPNPAVEVMQDLIGGGMSKASDAPVTSKLSSPLRQAAEKISVPDPKSTTESEQVSPISVGSFSTIESTVAGNSLTATAGESTRNGQHFVAEPAQMTDEPATFTAGGDHLGVSEQGGNKAFSYPGPPPASAQQESQSRSTGPSRGMSLPGYGQSSPRSPASTKRHKCPYCDTDFTRHHNLKSHLLTHSQEKPYICPTCQQRFRRLHDLKRHSKLHTGERPHECDKCGRKFARGDALARHNKGPGGCAGRRSSFGGGDEDYGGDGTGTEGMDGVEYTSHAEDHDGSDDHSRRGGAEGSRKRQQVETVADSDRQVYRQHSSTYPPPPSRSGRDIPGTMAPPSMVHPGSGSTSSPREASHPSTANGSSMGSYYSSGQVFSEPGMMTQSPRPLSPGQAPDGHRLSVGDASVPSGRNRSTSLTTQYQQQHFGRGAAGKASPRMSTQYPPSMAGGPPTILPPLAASSQSQPRGGLPASLSHPPPMSNTVPGSNAGSLSSHSRSSGNSIRDVLGPDNGDIWAYVRQLEGRFERMRNEYELRIQNLQEEIKLIRGQVTPSYGNDLSSGRY